MKKLAGLIVTAGALFILGACSTEPSGFPAVKRADQAHAKLLTVYEISFDVDSTTLDADALLIISRAARDAKRNATKVVVTGHADRAGRADYNMALSKKRAKVTAKALREQGVAGSIIHRDAKGEEDPAYSTADDIKFKENRRVSIKIYR